MTRLLCALGLLLSVVYNTHINAAEYSSTNGISNGIGIGGTVFNTWGLNYRRHFNNKWGMTVNLGGWISDSYGKLGTAVGGSYTFMHHAFKNKTFPNSSIRVYGVAYVSGIYGHGWLKPGEATAQHYFDFGFGIGPGAEYYFNKHFAVHLELPWMTFFRFAKNFSSFQSSHPHFGGGVSYYF